MNVVTYDYKQTVSLQAKAKINLTLDILGKRTDGYHEVCMIMQSIALADKIEARLIPHGIELSGNVRGVINPQDNLMYKVAELFLTEYHLTCGVALKLEKYIPIAAGLAGGSTDAAAVLMALNQLSGLNRPVTELCQLGAMLGSDIPFTLIGGTMLATGRGECLEVYPEAPLLHLVLVKPDIDVSTAWVYKHYAKVATTVKHPQTQAMYEALRAHDKAAIGQQLGNVLEAVTIPAHPILSRIKQQLLASGATACLMSGSGPTVFGLAASALQAEAIATVMKQDFPTAEVIVTTTAGRNYTMEG